MAETILEEIYRFPFKGFPGQKLEKTVIEDGKGIPGDRRFAVTNGTVDTGEWMPARSFFINAVVDGMSKFGMENDGNKFSLKNIDGNKLEILLDDPESLADANEKIARFMAPVGVREDLPTPQIIERTGKTANWDYVDTPISIINAETVKIIAASISVELDPLRFRGNLIISGLPAWEEFSWMGKRIRVGDAELEVHRPIDRCPTPGVNPETGERDVEVTPGIQNHFGHIYCGMYAKVVKTGDIAKGSILEPIGDAEMPWTEATAVENANAYALWPRLAEITTYQNDVISTRLSIKSATPWPLPDAILGQRLRLHLGPDQWTTEYITAISPEHIHMEVEDSKTDDPVTQLLREGLATGHKILVSGPFGRI
ncbi:MAG: MOSC domain-containing protein [Rhizobiaceae bacterium]